MSDCALTTRVFSAAQRAVDFNMRRGWTGEVAEQTSAGVRQHALDMTAAATESTLNTRRGWLSITGDRCGAACKAYGNAYTSTKPKQDRKGWLEHRLNHEACICTFGFGDCSFPCLIKLSLVGQLQPCPDATLPQSIIECAIQHMEAFMPFELPFLGPCRYIGDFPLPCPPIPPENAPRIQYGINLNQGGTEAGLSVFVQIFNVIEFTGEFFTFRFVDLSHFPFGQCPKITQLYGTYPNQNVCTNVPVPRVATGGFIVLSSPDLP